MVTTEQVSVAELGGGHSQLRVARSKVVEHVSLHRRAARAQRRTVPATQLRAGEAHETEAPGERRTQNARARGGSSYYDFFFGVRARTTYYALFNCVSRVF